MATIKNLFWNLITVSPFLFVVFIALGDRFLPSPLNEVSYNTRGNINEFIVGLFPEDKKDNNQGYDNKRSDTLINNVEQEAIK